MKIRCFIMWFIGLLLVAVIAYNWEMFIPCFSVCNVLGIYILRTLAALTVCFGLFYLLKPIAGCLIRIFIFLLALIFVL